MQVLFVVFVDCRNAVCPDIFLKKNFLKNILKMIK